MLSRPPHTTPSTNFWPSIPAKRPDHDRGYPGLPFVPVTTAPVLLFERNGDVHVFDSAPRAEQWMEAIDVEDGEYVVAYLPDGRRYLPTSEGGLIRLVPAGDADVDDLRRRLSAYRLRVPSAPATEDAAGFAAETLRWHAERRWSALLRRLLRLNQ